jgi:putative heme-binding domain-containing protein
LTPFHARQILGYKDPVLTKRMGEVWGLVKTTDEAKRKRMAELELIVHPLPVPQKDVLLADLPHGRQLFDRLCATCHRLYGQGREVGPDLTGSGRQHSDYLINNIVDPNALVPAEYRMNVITLKDGRVFNGIVHPSGDHAISVATPADSITIDRKEIESTEVSDQSMMPEGLLDGLKGKDIKDLLSYLMSNQQVELPGK